MTDFSTAIRVALAMTAPFTLRPDAGVTLAIDKSNGTSVRRGSAAKVAIYIPAGAKTPVVMRPGDPTSTRRQLHSLRRRAEDAGSLDVVFTLPAALPQERGTRLLVTPTPWQGQEYTLRAPVLLRTVLTEDRVLTARLTRADSAAVVIGEMMP